MPSGGEAGGHPRTPSAEPKASDRIPCPESLDSECQRNDREQGRNKRTEGRAETIHTSRGHSAGRLCANVQKGRDMDSGNPGRRLGRTGSTPALAEGAVRLYKP